MDPSFFTSRIRWMPWNKNREDYQYNPLFYIQNTQEKGMTPLGQLRGTEEIGFAVKTQNGFTSIYTAAPMLQSEIIRNIAKQAGVHVYSDDRDLVYANNRYVSVTSSKAGQRLILFPNSGNIYEALSNEHLAENVNRLKFEGKQFETRIFRLG